MPATSYVLNKWYWMQIYIIINYIIKYIITIIINVFSWQTSIYSLKPQLEFSILCYPQIDLIFLSPTALGYLWIVGTYFIIIICSLVTLESNDYSVFSIRLLTTHRVVSGHVVGAQWTSVKLNKNTRLETKGMLPSLCPNEDGNVENVFL